MGPDSEGVFTDGSAGLGHRRLAILDLSSAGNQPMVSPDGRLSISYNGEIYNFRELRAELEGMGYRFRSGTDTEVVLYACQQWGEECVSRFNGMFAVWDKKRRELFLARDRYGIKPLYYIFSRNSFIFASEQKALLTHPHVQREIGLEGLLEYFTFQNFFTDRTLFKDIRLFPAGSWAKVKPDSKTTGLRTVQYWDFDFREPENKIDDEEYIEELDRLFRQAVTRQ